MKHFSFDSGQGQDRDVNDRDNHDAEKHRVGDLFACGEHKLTSLFTSQSSPEFALANPELAHHVFNNHHRSVDQQTEVHRSQTHQVTRHPKLHHATQGKEKGKWNGCGNDERTAPITQQRKEQCSYQNGAFEKIGAHGVNGLVDQNRAVVLRLNLHIVRQLLLNLG